MARFNLKLVSRWRIGLSVASRYKNKTNQIIFTKVERSKQDKKWGEILGPNLSWKTANGVMLNIGIKYKYIPIFFWRKLI